MKRLVLLTGHFPQQKRRASLLWVSEALQGMGWHVTHVTLGYSWLSALRGDRRLQALAVPPEPGTRDLSPQLTAIYGQPPIHPFATGSDMLDLLLRPVHGLFPAYWAPRLKEPLEQANVVIAESGPPVMLARLLRRMAPQAQLIYRVNDDLRLLNAPAFLSVLETEYAGLFDRISTASPHLGRRFHGLAPVTLDPMGIPKPLLENTGPNPYEPHPGFDAVCAGTTQIDLAALCRIAAARPDWRLHVLGRLKTQPPDCPGLIFHGEQSFATTLRCIAHADIGLAPYIDRPGVEYQTANSNRILLYRHFGLPILAPGRLCHPSVPSIISYGDPQAWRRCETWQRQPEDLPGWTDLARRLVQNPDTDPPLEVDVPPDREICERV